MGEGVFCYIPKGNAADEAGKFSENSFILMTKAGRFAAGRCFFEMPEYSQKEIDCIYMPLLGTLIVFRKKINAIMDENVYFLNSLCGGGSVFCHLGSEESDLAALRRGCSLCPGEPLRKDASMARGVRLRELQYPEGK